jgi:hypothetical protein
MWSKGNIERQPSTDKPLEGFVMSKHRPSKGPLFLGKVKPETGGYEIFTKFVTIVLVGALPAFGISLAKTTVRAVGEKTPTASFCQRPVGNRGSRSSRPVKNWNCV